MKSSRILLLAVLLLTCAGVSLSAKSDGDDAAERRRQTAKANYIFDSALFHYTQNDDDAFFSLASYAHETNPADTFLSALAGMKSMMENFSDSTAVARGRRLADNYFYSAPDDKFLGIPYAKFIYASGDQNATLRLMDSIYNRNMSDAEVMFSYISVLGASRSEKNIDKAIEICNNYEALYGSDFNLFRSKAELYGLKKDSTAVINETRAMLAKSAESPYALTIVGAIYANYSTPDSAAYFFDKAIACDSSFGVPYIFRNNLYLTDGDTAKYIQSTLEAIYSPDLGEDTKGNLMAEYLTASVSSDSVASHADALLDYMADAYPHSLPVRDLAARYYAQTNDFARAEDNARFAIDLDPENEQSRVLLISIYYVNGEYEKAAKTALQAYNDMPDKTDFLFTASNSYLTDGKFDEALKIIDRIESRTDSTNMEALSNVWLTRGDIYSRMDSMVLSDAAYETAIRLNPQNSVALNNYAYNLACREVDIDRANDMIVKALSIKPDDVNSLDTYAWILFKKRDYKLAKSVIDGILETETVPNAELFEHAGDIYFMNGQPDEAVEFWKRAYELDPDNELLGRKVKNKAYYYK